MNVSTSTSAPPVAIAPPEIRGLAKVGQQLETTTGRWEGEVTSTALRWERVPVDDEPVVVAAGTPAYTPVDADAGFALRVVETATNDAGSTEERSQRTDPVEPREIAPGPPECLVAPSIAGTPRIGSELTADPGQWSSEVSVAYAWHRCAPDGQSCTAIPHATNPTYVPMTDVDTSATTPAARRPLPPVERGDDLGRTLRVVVTASNAAGTATATSAPVGPVVLGSHLPDPPEM